MKKIIAIFLAIAVVFSGGAPSYGATADPVVTGETAIVMDMNTGEVLFEKNSHDTRYPASTTKIMTAILALENLELDTEIAVDDKTPFEVEGSHIALVPGEVLTVNQLLHAMMTESANDCALVLGKAVSGSTEEFAKLMNQRAKELGAKNTNFVNPNGLHNPEHLSSAYDLAMMSRYAMTDPKISKEFRELVTTYKYYVPPTNKQPERFLYNTNRLLYDTVHTTVINGVKRVYKYDGVTGIKTGYTSHAGGCLVSSAQRDGTEILTVVMKSTDNGRFSDCIAMLDWGFENYKTVAKEKAGAALGTVKVKTGAVKNVEAVLSQDVYVTVPAEASADLVTTKILLDPSVKAPIAKGQMIGQVEVYESDTLITTVAALAAEAVEKGGILSYIGVQDVTAKKIGIGLLAAFVLLSVLIFIYIMIKRRQVRLRKERRRLRAEQRKKAESARRDAWEAEYERHRHETYNG